MQSQSNQPTEVVLKGGRANVGEVVRVGEQVARPTYPQTPAVDHFLGYLRAQLVDFVPRPHGRDQQGRQRLDYRPGIVATPPYPSWAFSEDLLVDVARHQRLLQHVALGYRGPSEPRWAHSAGDYFPTEAFSSDELVVCHNDLGMSNTVVHHATRRVAGFIDFDYCRPVDPLFDIAVAARHWVPFGDLDLAETTQLDRCRRFALFCDVHELSPDQRYRVCDLAMAFLDQARANIAALARAGRQGFAALLAGGYEQTNLATVAWISDHRAELCTTVVEDQHDQL